MPDARPNLLFVLTDHQAFYGHDRPEFRYKLPHFEAFAEQGVRFERAYCVAPVCTPARSSMMSGIYPSHHGLIRNTDGGAQPDSLCDFRTGQPLYCHYLARAGYRNAYVGKWHCGKTRLAEDYGAEGWSLPDYGKVYMSDAYKAYAAERGLGDARARIEHNLNHPEWEGQTLALHDSSPWKFMNGSGVLEGPPEAHEEQFVAQLAVRKIEELARTAQPWSLVASFWGPHQPYYPTEPFASRVDPKSIPEYPSFRDDLEGRPYRYVLHRDFSHRSAQCWPEWSTWQKILARAYGQGYQMDAAVGGILAALDRLGLAENTLVFWCSDHGDALASHGGMWDKASTYIEEVARVPLAVRWPKGFKGGGRCSKFASNMDVTATLLEAAGAPVPEHMHSRSLLPLCREPQSAAWPDQLVCEHHGHGDNITQRIIFCGRFKYVAALFDGDELYDLEADPFERRNLIDAPEHAGTRKDLRARLVDHIERTKDPKARKLAHRLRLGR